MPNPVFPLSRKLRLGFEMIQRDQRVASQFDVGEAQVRARSTRAVWDVRGTIVVTDSEFSTFRAFYQTTLGGGVSRFDWGDPYTGATREWRFKPGAPGYRVSAITPRGTELALELEMFE